MKQQSQMNDFHEIHLPWIRESNLIEGINDEQADRDSFDAWRRFTETPQSLDSILRLHRDVMFRRDSSIGGFYRRVDVGVGGYSAPAYKRVPNLMQKWFGSFSKARTAEEIKVSHITFERIHPFVDGNGRIGRMILNRQRLDAGLDILVLYANERQKYYQWFHEKIPKDFGWASRFVNKSVDEARSKRDMDNLQFFRHFT